MKMKRKKSGREGKGPIEKLLDSLAASRKYPRMAEMNLLPFDKLVPYRPRVFRPGKN